MQKYILLPVKVAVYQVKMEKCHCPSRPGLTMTISYHISCGNASLFVLAIIPETLAPIILGRMNQCVHFLSALVWTKRIDSNPEELSDGDIILNFV